MKTTLEALITKRLHIYEYTMPKGCTLLHVPVDCFNLQLSQIGILDLNISGHWLRLINPKTVEVTRSSDCQSESLQFYIWELKENWQEIKAEYEAQQRGGV